jgi:hypothetical protein
VQHEALWSLGMRSFRSNTGTAPADAVIRHALGASGQIQASGGRCPHAQRHRQDPQALVARQPGFHSRSWVL